MHKKRVKRIHAESFAAMSVGQRLQWLLVVRRLTQSEASRQSGISQATIATLVSTPSRSPSAKTLLALAHVLGTSPEFLLLGEGSPLHDSVSYADEEVALLAAFRKLDARGRNNMMMFVQILIQQAPKNLSGQGLTAPPRTPL